MTFNEALEYLNSFVNYEQIRRYPYESAYKLQRMQELCAFLGNPEKELKCVHIGGTKGKGSVAAMTESILRAAGLKTGFYTSPHLVSIRERIQIGGEPISPENFARCTDQVKRMLENKEFNPRHGTHTFFEILTLVAFLAFARENVDIAVLEVGLGGRLDATNVVTPLAVGLVPVSFEHASILGVTLERIAREKCGIIKENVPVVSAPQTDLVREVIEATCKARHAPIAIVGRELQVERKDFDLESQRLTIQGLRGAHYKDISIPLLGMHQARNAAVALGLIEVLQKKGFTISSEGLRKGFAGVRWPGRLEIVSRDPLIILDGAQNADSAQALAAAVKGYFKFEKLILVLGILNDKDFEGVGKSLCRLADEVIFTETDHVHSVSANFLNSILGKLCKKKRAVSDIREALEAAKQSSGTDDLILVAGSLYLVGAMRRILVGSGELEDVGAA